MQFHNTKAAVVPVTSSYEIASISLLGHSSHIWKLKIRVNIFFSFTQSLNIQTQLNQNNLQKMPLSQTEYHRANYGYICPAFIVKHTVRYKELSPENDQVTHKKHDFARWFS